MSDLGESTASRPFVYMDASAAAKLIKRESETEALSAWLTAFPRRLSSELLRVELTGFSDRNRLSRSEAEAVLADIRLVPVTSDTISDSLQHFTPALRALDAIHLGVALRTRRILTAFVTYDMEQAAAARGAGLTVVSPE